MKKEEKKGTLLEIIMYVLNVALGIFSMYYAGIEVKSFWKYIGLGIGFWFVLEIIIFIGTIILNKKFNRNIDAEESQNKAVVYFISNIITFIVLAMSMEGSTKILGIIVGIFLFDFIPVILTFAVGNNSTTDSIMTSKREEKTNSKFTVKSHDIYDKFGNKIASSTTYNDGITDREVTYVKDLLGNTISESSSMDGHTTTKINTTGRF